MEDDTGVADLISTTLTHDGYTAICAHSVREAVETSAASTEGFQLLLSDMILPAGSGVELANRLKTEAPAFKAIYMSGHDDETLSMHGIHASDFNFLRKPFAPTALLEKIGSILDS